MPVPNPKFGRLDELLVILGLLSGEISLTSILLSLLTDIDQDF